MIIITQPNATEEQVQQIVARVRQFGLEAHISRGASRVIIGVIGPEAQLREKPLAAMAGVEAIVPVLKPYKLAARDSRGACSVAIGDVRLGEQEDVVLICGPCSVESREQILSLATAVKESGAKILRGGAFKPRTSPYSFQGLREEGLRYLAEARQKTGLPVVTEVMDPRDLSIVEEYADCLQVGTPLARNDFQHVRTTAYTHTEADHREFGNRNALGGELRAAGPAIRRAEVVPRATLAYEVPRAIPVEDPPRAQLQRAAYSPPLERFSASERRTASVRMRRANVVSLRPSLPGSAAADWARWPAGTVFRLLSTGQTYRVEDYGWALAGRNTIDLYMPNQREMNQWGVRQQTIQILKWGDPQESLNFLRRHQDYKHIRRMVLELEGREKEAAALR